MYSESEQAYGGNALHGLDQAKMAHVPTCKQRIDASVKAAEDRLAKLKEAQEILSRQPDLERLLDIMQQSHF